MNEYLEVSNNPYLQIKKEGDSMNTTKWPLDMFGTESIEAAKFNRVDMFDFKPIVDKSTGFLTEDSHKELENKLGFKVDPESKVLLGELKLIKQ